MRALIIGRMKLAQLVPLFASALLFGWLAPDLSAGHGAGGHAQATGVSPADRDAKRRTREWLAGQTVLKRQRDGHFYTNANVDGAQVRFLVDTGASIVALTADDAAAAGISWDEQSLRPIGRGASGTVNGVPVRIERMDINGIEARDVQAAIIPDGLDVSLMGQSFLRHIDTVDIDGDEMKMGG